MFQGVVHTRYRVHFDENHLYSIMLTITKILKNVIVSITKKFTVFYTSTDSVS